MQINIQVNSQPDSWGNECDEVTAEAAATRLATMLRSHFSVQYPDADIDITVRAEESSQAIQVFGAGDENDDNIETDIREFIAANWINALDAVLADEPTTPEPAPVARQQMIYVKAADAAVFDRALEISSQDSLSATIAAAVRQFVAAHDATADAFQEYTLEPGTAAEAEQPVRFGGRKIAHQERTDDGGQQLEDWTVYQTRGGRIVVEYSFWSVRGSGGHTVVTDYADLAAVPQWGDASPISEAEHGIPGGARNEALETLGHDPARYIE